VTERRTCAITLAATALARDYARMLTSTKVPSRRRLSLALALALGSSSVAAAAPSVTTQDTSARSAPFKVAPVLQTLQAGTHVVADDAATNGWRRIELPDGRFAFVPDGDVKADPSWVPPKKVAAAPPEAAVPPAPRTLQPVEPIAGESRPLQYVTDFRHLADLVKSDPEVFDLADEIATRRTTAAALVAGGLAGGVALRILAQTALQKETCTALLSGGQVCVESDNETLDLVGLAVMVAGPLLGAVFWPTRADQTRVINAWNERHPSRPFVDGGGVQIR
jgi:hypothetical protein